MNRYIRFYKAYPGMLRLHGFEFVIYFAAWFSEVAIYTLLLKLNAPATVIALITAFNFIPALIISPFSGVIIDFINAKKLLFALAFVQIMATFGMLFIDSYALVWLLGLLLFVKMAAASMHFQTDMTITAKIVENENLHIANELQAAIWSFCYSAGMATSGFFTARYGIDAAFMADILIIVLALPLLFFIPFPKSLPKKQSVLFMFKEGVYYVVNEKRLLAIMLLHATVGLIIIDVLLTLLADVYYKELISVSVAIGLMNASKAFGLMVGAPLLGRLANEKNLPLFFLLIGLLFAVWGFFFITDFYMTLLFLLLIGSVAALLWAYTYTMLQRATERAYLGRVLAFNDMGFMVFGVMITLGIGYLYDFGIPLGIIAVTIGSLFVLSGVIYKVRTDG